MTEVGRDLVRSMTIVGSNGQAAYGDWPGIASPGTDGSVAAGCPVWAVRPPGGTPPAGRP
ncbi:hypothetical protein ATKI12_0759 [Kitasatospora sp. Ki12]